MTAAEWIANLQMWMPEQWQASPYYRNKKYAAPGSVVLTRSPELREKLKLLKAEDIQPRLDPLLCCGNEDFLRSERKERWSKYLMSLDAKMNRSRM